MKTSIINGSEVSRLSVAIQTAGQETQQRLGYYSKLEHLIRALINHEIRTCEAKTLQEMQDQITYISIWCEKAFTEVAA
ncbi:hypothetical protein [Pantoea anthophila]|uniref:hypothetical protein n=1 Tax=Pantoea anthophila TaxID=470931 RepID=UPI002DBABE95|nr:hypothetical protein [Pantoea anthophila]MEB6222042.1 hypothetical protein [Pantoea anthophila]